MLANRFHQFWAAEVPPIPVGSGFCGVPGFAPCPWPLPATQHAHAAYLYRVAFEYAQAEIARERRARWTAFSLN